MKTIQKKIEDKIESIANDLEYSTYQQSDYSNTGIIFITDDMLNVYFSIHYNFQTSYFDMEISDANNKLMKRGNYNYTEITDFLGLLSEILDKHRND